MLDNWLNSNKTNKLSQRNRNLIKSAASLAALLISLEITKYLVKNIANRWNRTLLAIFVPILKLLLSLGFCLDSIYVSVNGVSYLYKSILVNNLLVKLQVFVNGPYAPPLVLFTEKLLKCHLISFFAGYGFHFLKTKNQPTVFKISDIILSLGGVLAVVYNF
uniref:Uncharacterized protein n=1 Tax=Boodleopsis sp. FL1161 TaxID=2364084 RepID=A0A386AZB3_9CHLO|nr:hypothetical protein [Boodleopsis sp. FL1161]